MFVAYLLIILFSAF